jgi:hypothetical protein
MNGVCALDIDFECSVMESTVKRRRDTVFAWANHVLVMTLIMSWRQKDEWSVCLGSTWNVTP